MSLDVYQQVFSLSVASNLVNDLKGKQEALQDSLQSILKDVALPMLGGWELAWGPVVWKNKPDDETTGPDNSWYVAYHPKLRFEDGTIAPTYVIAVAGTPVQSQYAWFRENFAVNTVADFKQWVEGGIVNPPEAVTAKDVVKGNAYIAIGTVNAVHLLLNTASPEGAQSAGMNLREFLATTNAQSNDPRFVATGHSLGGALSPSLALALVQAGVIPAQRTLTYPSAGPSPGNDGFTDLFTQTFPAAGSGEEGSYKVWNRNIVNLLDVVPQAWSAKKFASPEQNLGNIPTIYGEPALPIVLSITIIFAVHVLRAGVLYEPLPGQYFKWKTPTPPENLLQFIQVLGPQHDEAYAEFIGITLPKLNKERLRAGLNEKSEKEQRFNHPVIADYEWALEHPEETQKEVGEIEGVAGGLLFFEAEE